MPSSESEYRIRLTGARERSETAFDLVPAAGTRALLAEEMGVSAIRKLRLSGRLLPEGRSDWRLEAELGATVVQPCGVTLDPVTTRIDQPVARRYLAAYDLPDAAEQEMPEDTDAEALPAVLDLMTVLTEELALAIPPFPRAEGAGAVEAAARPDGAAPIRDADLKPFAGLRDALSGSSEPDKGSPEE